MAIGTGFQTVLDAARAGAPWAFERLYAELSPGVHKYLSMRGTTEPEDLTSEVFLTLFERLGAFEGSTEDKFRSWVFTIAHHKATDELRRVYRRPWTETPYDGAVELAGGDVETDAFEAIGTAWVHDILTSLSEVQREVLLLRVVAGLTISQVAAAMGKSEGAIKQHQRRAVVQLREQVQHADVTL